MLFEAHGDAQRRRVLGRGWPDAQRLLLLRRVDVPAELALQKLHVLSVSVRPENGCHLLAHRRILRPRNWRMFLPVAQQMSVLEQEQPVLQVPEHRFLAGNLF